MTTSATHIDRITHNAQVAGWTNCSSTLVAAVLNGTAMIATTGAGVSRELADFILGQR